MIDFRYHIISIVAVFLALGIGILLGTSLAEPLAEDISRRLDRAEATNTELQRDLDERDALLRAADDFAAAAGEHLVTGALTGQRYVVVAFQGADDGFIERIRQAIEEAGGQVATQVLFTEELELRDEVQRARLAPVVGSDAQDADALRAETMRLLGARAAAAAAGDGGRSEQAASSKVESLLNDLQEDGFVALETSSDGPPVPSGAEFVLGAGSSQPPAFDVTAASAQLAGTLAEGGAPVVAAEPVFSEWGVVEHIRGDGTLREMVVTVDSADTVAGEVALVFGLDCADEGIVGHYGTGEGAEPLPRPLAGC